VADIEPRGAVRAPSSSTSKRHPMKAYLNSTATLPCRSLWCP